MVDFLSSSLTDVEREKVKFLVEFIMRDNSTTFFVVKSRKQDTVARGSTCRVSIRVDNPT